MRRCGGVELVAAVLLSLGARGTREESTLRRLIEEVEAVGGLVAVGGEEGWISPSSSSSSESSSSSTTSTFLAPPFAAAAAAAGLADEE